ncbi:hypothetical protein MNBD_PLANCTO02-1404 [hydrothermal vent metagenome]|uniref:Uncharacterized protein n=1 Tax=hydrothermal vent metagenome TaxID=652676 RepID=A0A3B1DUX7_9ZZZZ
MKLLKTLLAFALVCSSATVFAADSQCSDGSCAEQPCTECESEKTCLPESVTQKVKKSCYRIEYKEICIPKVRFPWEKYCEPKCGKVITVKILKKKKYTRKKQATKWNIFSIAKGNCTDNSCTSVSHKHHVITPQPADSAYLSPTPPPAPAVVIPKQ